MSRDVICPRCGQHGKAYVLRRGERLLGVQVWHGGNVVHAFWRSFKPNRAFVDEALGRLLGRPNPEAGRATLEDAVRLLEERREMLQSEFWRALGVDSRRGSNMVRRLVKKGLVRRRRVKAGRAYTYRLTWVGWPSRAEVEKAEVSLELDDAPCFLCPSVESCTSPTCAALNRWLREEAAKLG